MIKPGRQIDLKPGAPASNQRRHHRLCGIDISKTERRWRMIKRDIKLPVPGSGDSSRAAGFFSDDAGQIIAAMMAADKRDHHGTIFAHGQNRGLKVLVFSMATNSPDHDCRRTDADHRPAGKKLITDMHSCLIKMMINAIKPCLAVTGATQAISQTAAKHGTLRR